MKMEGSWKIRTRVSGPRHEVISSGEKGVVGFGQISPHRAPRPLRLGTREPRWGSRPQEGAGRRERVSGI